MMCNKCGMSFAEWGAKTHNCSDRVMKLRGPHPPKHANSLFKIKYFSITTIIRHSRYNKKPRSVESAGLNSGVENAIETTPGGLTALDTETKNDRRILAIPAAVSSRHI